MLCVSPRSCGDCVVFGRDGAAGGTSPGRRQQSSPVGCGLWSPPATMQVQQTGPPAGLTGPLQGPEKAVCCSLCLCMAVAVLSSVSLVYLTFIGTKTDNQSNAFTAGNYSSRLPGFGLPGCLSEVQRSVPARLQGAPLRSAGDSRHLHHHPHQGDRPV